MTKIATLIVFIAATVLVSAQDAPLPEKLSALKTSYQAAVARATTPLAKTYLTELERLKIEYTKKGDLQAALAVDAELKALAPSPTATTEDMSDTEKKKVLKAWLMERPWAYGPQTLTFNKEETASCTDGSKWTYKVKSPTTIILQNKEFSIDMSLDTISLPKFGPDGGDRLLRRKTP